MAQKDVKTFTKDDLSGEICCIVGTRPGIVMFAPIIHELKNSEHDFFVLHTGQHYSPNMDSDFFDDLELPNPDYKLDGMAEHKTHASQTAAMMAGIEAILMARRPKVVLVGGDANTNLAGALAARKLNMVVCHVEAGNRSYDWRMPEEHNRVVIDSVSDILFASDEHAVKILQDEKKRGEIVMCGNPIVDASFQNLEVAKKKSTILNDFGLTPGGYVLQTAHREECVDHKETLEGILQGVSDAALALEMQNVFLIHPRTEKRLNEFGIKDWAYSLPNMVIKPAVAYLDFMMLLSHTALFFTDSGGGQQEACIHQIPCVTTRRNTEWVDTITVGANRLAGSDPAEIMAKAKEAMEAPKGWTIPFGDGTSAKQIVERAARATSEPVTLNYGPKEEEAKAA